MTSIQREIQSNDLTLANRFRQGQDRRRVDGKIVIVSPSVTGAKNGFDKRFDQ
jgi:hypothetical protein